MGVTRDFVPFHGLPLREYARLAELDEVSFEGMKQRFVQTVKARCFAAISWAMALPIVLGAEANGESRPTPFVDGGSVLKRLGAKMGEGVSARDLANYGVHFESVDRDGDGKHSPTEFIDQGFYLTPIARRGIFRAADTDSDGFVTRSEYILNRIITDEAKAIVQAMDDNGDGVVQRSEFVRNAFAPDGDVALAEAVFDEWDSNQDGQIIVPEYLRVWGQWARQDQGSIVAKDTSRSRARELGIAIGDFPPGKWNAITDVPGVLVGHTTVHEGKNIHTGVTVVLPHDGNIFQEKVPAAIVVGNGFGKLVGSTQVAELGNIETPIALTSTLSVGSVMSALVRHTLDLPGNEWVRSVNAVVGETNDGSLNDIRNYRVSEQQVFTAIQSAQSGPIEEGAVGAGSGTRCFGFKGGIGSASRVVKTRGGQSYMLGVLVQSNFGGDLAIDGVQIGDAASVRKAAMKQPEGDGSCMIVVATDAPLSVRSIERIAQRALHGMARTGASMSNGSGDYVIGFSTAYRVADRREAVAVPPLLSNASLSPLFRAVMDATEEAIYNSLLMATTVEGMRGTAEAIDLELVRRALSSR